MINIEGMNVTVDKEKQKKQGIQRLEIDLTEDGEIKQVYIQRYAFACNWSMEESIEKSLRGKPNE
ncbi:hypothetical protein CCZ20_24585 [Priestia aryabhattai]|nr:hypothetical protein [Priestia aryabhattai]OVE34831.1 hypothetical protein CCZ20_24585 [Priestia aryabhattai]